MTTTIIEELHVPRQPSRETETREYKRKYALSAKTRTVSPSSTLPHHSDLPPLPETARSRGFPATQECSSVDSSSRTQSPSTGLQSPSALCSFLRTLVQDREVTVLDDNHRLPIAAPVVSSPTPAQLNSLHHQLTPPRRKSSLLELSDNDDERTLSARSSPPPPHAPLVSPVTSGRQSISSVYTIQPRSSPSFSAVAAGRHPTRKTHERPPSPIRSPPLHRDSRWSPDSSLNWSSSSLDASFLEHARIERPSSDSRSTIDGAMSLEVYQDCILPIPPTRQFNPDSPPMPVVQRKQSDDSKLPKQTVDLIHDIASCKLAKGGTVSTTSKPPRYASRASL